MIYVIYFNVEIALASVLDSPLQVDLAFLPYVFEFLKICIGAYHHNIMRYAPHQFRGQPNVLVR